MISQSYVTCDRLLLCRERQHVLEKEGGMRMFELLKMERLPDIEDASMVLKELPLHFDGSERMRFRYALFLLNKACHLFTYNNSQSVTLLLLGMHVTGGENARIGSNGKQ